MQFSYLIAIHEKDVWYDPMVPWILWYFN